MRAHTIELECQSHRNLSQPIRIIKGHREGGKYLARTLLKEGVDVAYSYKPLHRPLGHAFFN